jgi:hypothetical protein
MIILRLWPVTGLTSYFSVTLAFNVNIVKVNECNKLEERESLKSTPLINFLKGRGYGYIVFVLACVFQIFRGGWIA